MSAQSHLNTVDRHLKDPCFSAIFILSDLQEIALAVWSPINLSFYPWSGSIWQFHCSLAFTPLTPEKVLSCRNTLPSVCFQVKGLLGTRYLLMWLVEWVFLILSCLHMSGFSSQLCIYSCGKYTTVLIVNLPKFSGLGRKGNCKCLILDNLDRSTKVPAAGGL